MYVHLQCPPHSSSTRATITDEAGRELPLACTKATVEIDWNTGAPPKATLECLAWKHDIWAKADVLLVDLGGKKYRLVEAPD